MKMDPSHWISTTGRKVQPNIDYGSIIDTVDLVLNWSASKAVYTGNRDETRAGATSQHDSHSSDHNNSTNGTCLGALKPPTDVSCTTPWANKRPAAGTSNLFASTKGRRETMNRFPAEILEMLISRLLTAKPKCRLNLVVPDWKLEHDIGIMRVLTYTRGAGVSHPGSLSCGFVHGDDDHILTPTASFDPKVVALGEKFTQEYVRKLYRTHTHVFTLGISTIVRSTPDGLHANDWRNPQPLRSAMRDILPFDDEPTGSIKVTAYPSLTPIYGHLRHIVVHSPLSLLCMDTRAFERPEEANRGPYNTLDLDRSAHLWISWSRMPNLETVALDLRIYSHRLNTERRCLSKKEIIARAHEMGRHLRLKTLVLAGLQSYDFYYSYNHMGKTARKIEQLETLNGEPNWVRIFRPAVREGGRIILVDKFSNWVPN